MARQKIDKTNLGYLGVEYQYKLVKYFIEDEGFFDGIVNIVDPNAFTEPALRNFVGIIKDKYLSNNIVPSYEMIGIIVKSKAKNSIDLEELFSHKKLVIALKIDFQVILNIIETCGGIKKFAILENKAQTNHNQEFFSELKLSFKKNKDKDRINNSTLEKFSKLWQKNCCKNITRLSTHYGINIFQNKCPQNLPVVILAAGPTLSAVLPYLLIVEFKRFS